MSRRELIVSGPAGDPRVREQLQTLAADPEGAAEREVEVLEREAETFCVELMGKDGSVRARWGDQVTLCEVWSRIDAMPARRRELRERAAGDQATRSAPV